MHGREKEREGECVWMCALGLFLFMPIKTDTTNLYKMKKESLKFIENDFIFYIFVNIYCLFVRSFSLHVTNGKFFIELICLLHLRFTGLSFLLQNSR